ncbi:MAG TPA: glycosyltransferase family 4 protein [Thermotogae bacterium]|nr:glycosyltransferase family 4 protein [Thermotogota bacterium]
MRIGLFTDTYDPQINGVVTSIKMLKNQLERQGHEVWVVTVSHPDTMVEERVIRIPSVKAPGMGGQRFGVPISARTIVQLHSLNLDLIHSHTPFTIGVVGLHMARKRDIPVVHTYHTLYEEYVHYVPFFHGVLKQSMRKYSKGFCDRHDAIVAPSVKIKRILENYGVSAPIFIVPNGISLEEFAHFSPSKEEMATFREKFGIDEQDKVVLFVGRLAQEKRLDLLLVNFKKVLRKEPKAKLLFVGDGPQRHRLERQSHEMGIGARVMFTGFLDWPREIALVHRVSHVFVSVSDTEVHPISFIEAMASGLPIVAFDDDALDGVVIHGQNGYRFSNKLEVWRGIVSILRDEKLRQRMSEESQTKAASFSAETFAERVLRVYETAMINHAVRREPSHADTGG